MFDEKKWFRVIPKGHVAGQSSSVFDGILRHLPTSLIKIVLKLNILWDTFTLNNIRSVMVVAQE